MCQSIYGKNFYIVRGYEVPTMDEGYRPGDPEQGQASPRTRTDFYLGMLSGGPHYLANVIEYGLVDVYLVLHHVLKGYKLLGGDNGLNVYGRVIFMPLYAACQDSTFLFQRLGVTGRHF